MYLCAFENRLTLQRFKLLNIFRSMMPIQISAGYLKPFTMPLLSKLLAPEA